MTHGRRRTRGSATPGARTRMVTRGVGVGLALFAGIAAGMATIVRTQAPTVDSAQGRQAERVVIKVDAAKRIGPMKPVWAWFGYDEPNYTYMKDGQKLLTELSKLSPVPVFVRTHNLLTSGDGTPGLKWGSTNAYTEDANGKPIYDWTIVDRIIDTYLKRGMKPMMQIGFMPEAMSVKPQPYRHDWQPGVPYNRVYTGWAHPPKDYAKWGELVYQWARHSVQKYGRAEVESWVWEVWNEPDIGYWQSTPRRVLQAVRLRGRRPQARAADGAHRRAGGHRSERGAHPEVPARLHRALPARHQPRDRKGRLASRLHHVPRQGCAARHQGERDAVRADVGQQPAPRHREWVRDRRLVS